MLLTDEERAKFAAWCRNEANSTHAIVDQMKAMPGVEALTKQKRIEAMACLVVAGILGSFESQTIKGGE